MSLLSIHLMIALLPCVAAANGPDHSKWDALVKRYVNAEARVDYKSWKASGLADLDTYVSEIAAPWPAGMEPPSTKAALINAYNALTVRWILSNYPVESIEKTNDPFKAGRHTLSGRPISLDTIEARLRATGDPRIHAALVCAGRSCPPLRREAYAAAHIDEQLDDNVRAWLANPQLNRFIPTERLARVSSIFKWYAGDFESTGGITPFLVRFAPTSSVRFLREPNAKIEFIAYNWGLNDTSALGSDYSQKDLYVDLLRGALRNPWLYGALFAVILTAVFLIRRAVSRRQRKTRKKHPTES